MREFPWLKLSSDLLINNDSVRCVNRPGSHRYPSRSTSKRHGRQEQEEQQQQQPPCTAIESLAVGALKDTVHAMAMTMVLPMTTTVEKTPGSGVGGRGRSRQGKAFARQSSTETCVRQMPQGSATADRRVITTTARNFLTVPRPRPTLRCTLSAAQVPQLNSIRAESTSSLPLREPSPEPPSLADRHLIDPPLPPPTPRRSPPRRSLPMALKFLSSGGSNIVNGSSGVKHFDIRLDNDYIVFRGNEDEAPAVPFGGSVVLCLSEPLTVTHVTLTLSGMVHMSWQTASTSSISGKRSMSRENTFFEKTWTFRTSPKTKTEILAPENYEWPFDCVLEGNLPESVEGLKDAWIIYRLKAEIGRKRGKDIVVRKPLRLVRTLDSSALELSHEMSVENIWPNKIQYSISIPSKAVAFGSFLRVDFKLVSLLKGLTIGNVSTQVREEQEFLVDPEWSVHALNGGHTKSDRIVALDMYAVNADHDEQIIDEAAEGYQFTRYLELPKSLNDCIQECNIKGIKVRHKVKFNVQLHNPDGHISELRANLPISLYISPSLPINENNNLVDPSPQAGRAAVENDLAHAAPPLYGKHTLDKLYSEVDPHGYLTPGMTQSRSETPYLRSLNASSDNIARLNGHHSNSSAPHTPTGSSVSAAALQHRLQNLHVGPSSHLAHEEVDTQAHIGSHDSSRRSSAINIPNSDYFGNRSRSDSYGNPRISPRDLSDGYVIHSGSGSAAASRRISEEDEADGSGARTPFAQYDHMEDLAKLPSYSTAVKSAAPRRCSYSTATSLPTYGAVITGSSPPTLTEPPTAHIRTSLRSSSLATSPPEVLINGSRTPPVNRSVGALQDEERQLRHMQHRAS